MEYIINYLERLFAKLPQTEELEQEKERMFSAAKTEYEQLRAQGLNEAAAVSQILDEFSSIDDLANQYICQQHTDSQLSFYAEDNLPILDQRMVKDYIKMGQQNAFYKAVGVAIIIWAFIVPIVSSTISEFLAYMLSLGFFGGTVGHIFAFAFIFVTVCGIVLLCASKKKAHAFDFLKKGCYIAPSGRQELDTFLTTGFDFSKSLIVGVLLCAISPFVTGIVALVLPGGIDSLAAACFFLFVGAGVFVLVYRSVMHRLMNQCREFLLRSVRRSQG